MMCPQKFNVELLGALMYLVCVGLFYEDFGGLGGGGFDVEAGLG